MILIDPADPGVVRLKSDSSNLPAQHVHCLLTAK
jgi:hypothetical protein